MNDQPTHGAELGSRRLGGVLATVTAHPPGMQLAPHTHRFPCITVVTGGAYAERYGSTRRDCGPGTLLLKPAGLRHSNEYAERGATSVVLQLVDPASDVYRFSMPTEPWAGDAAAARFLASRIREEVDFEDEASPLIVDGLLRAILGLAGRAARRASSAEPAWLRIVRDRLHSDLRTPVSVGELALLCGVDPDHLSNRFKERYGVRIGEYRRHLRLERAAELLRTSRQSASTIAMETGFYDQSHFTRAFRAEFGLPPGQYRREYRSRKSLSSLVPPRVVSGVGSS